MCFFWEVLNDSYEISYRSNLSVEHIFSKSVNFVYVFRIFGMCVTLAANNLKELHVWTDKGNKVLRRFPFYLSINLVYSFAFKSQQPASAKVISFPFFFSPHPSSKKTSRVYTLDFQFHFEISLIKKKIPLLLFLRWKRFWHDN